MYQFTSEKMNIFQLQLEASRFGKVKVEPMIFELSDSIGEDVHEVLVFEMISICRCSHEQIVPIRL
jgi:hypothetical protein